MKKHTAKIITLLLSIVSAVCLIMGIAGCDGCSNADSGHQHAFKSDWKYDETNHWHEADCEHTNLTDGLAAHNYGTDNVCDDCGYVQTEAGHQHTFAKAWEYDETNHWHVATCGHTNLTDGLAAHNYGTDNVCDDCGYVQTEGGHTHTFKKTWEYNETNHWHEADCGHTNLTEGLAEHEYDNGNTCLTCGYTLPEGHTHELSNEYEHDNTYHWYPALCNHNVKGNLEKHNFNSDNECEDCGYEYVPTQDELDVYELYKKQAEIKGEEALSFIDWRLDLAEQGVDYIEVTTSGDGRVYYGASDYTGTVMYVAERTVEVSATFNGEAYSEVGFKVVAVADGDTIVLATGRTNTEGVATIKFVPVMGYSSSEVKYVVTPAEAEDADASKNAYSYLTGEEELTYIVGEEDDKSTFTYTYVTALGVGNEVHLELAASRTATMDIYLTNLAEGFYTVKFTGAGDSAVGMHVQVDSGHAYEMWSGTASCVIYISEGSKKLVFKNSNYAANSTGLVARNGEVSLAEAPDFTTFTGAGKYSIRTTNPRTFEILYKIDVEPGIYSMQATLYGSQYNGLDQQFLNIVIGNREYKLSGYGISAATGSRSGYATFLPINDGDKYISFYIPACYGYENSSSYSHENLILEITAFDKDFNDAEVGKTVSVPFSYEARAGVNFTAPESAVYIVTMTRTAGTTSLANFGSITEELSGKTLTAIGAGTVTEKRVFFNAKAGEKLLFYLFSSNNGSNYALTVNFTITMHLDTPEITLNSGVISWEPVVGATGYIVYSATSATATTYTKLTQEPIAATSYKLTDSSAIKYYTVSAVDDTADTLYSESMHSNAVSYPTVLTAPVAEIHANVITWQPVPGATGYKVYSSTSSSVSSATEVATVKNGDMHYVIVSVETVRYYWITAIHEGDSNYTAESAKSDSVQYLTKLATPEVSVEGGVISWNEVAYATGYKLEISGTICSLDENDAVVSTQYNNGYTKEIILGKVTSYTVSFLTGQYTIKVTALSGSEHYTDSAASSTTYYETVQLAAPKLRVETGEDGKLYMRWDRIIATNPSYQWCINSYTGSSSSSTEVVSVDLDYSSYVSQLVIGENTLSVYASTSNSTYKNIFLASEVVTIVYIIEAQQLAAPVITWDSEKNTLSWDAVPHTAYYRVYRNDDVLTTTSGTSYMISDITWDVGRYEITVDAYNSYNTAIYSDSKKSNAIDYTVTAEHLATPVLRLKYSTSTNASMQTIMVQWDYNTKASIYYVYINGIEVKATTSNSFSLSDADLSILLETENVDLSQLIITLKAKNEKLANRYIDSDSSEPVVVAPTKFAAPTLELTSNGYGLTWSQIKTENGIFANVYTIYINGVQVDSKNAMTSSTASFSWSWSDSEIAELITPAESYVVTVTAKFDTHCIVFPESEAGTYTFTPAKLATPAISIVGEKIMLDNAITGASNYNVYFDGVLIFRGRQSNGAIDLSSSTNKRYLGAVISGVHAITVTAINTTAGMLFLESEKSNDVTYTVAHNDEAQYVVRFTAANTTNWNWSYELKIGLYEKDSGTLVGTATITRNSTAATYGTGTVTAPNNKAYIWKIENMPEGFTSAQSVDAVWMSYNASTSYAEFTVSVAEAATETAAASASVDASMPVFIDKKQVIVA